MNVELTRKALEKVGNPHVLVNIISRRVRQLNGGGGSGGPSRPLVEIDPGMGVADIALLELINDKMSFQMEDEGAAGKVAEPAKRKRRTRSLTA